MSKVLRVGVLDENGVKVNTILVDEDAIDTYDPGYGSTLVVEGLEPDEPTPAPLAERPKMQVLRDLKAILQTGDRLDFKTMEVIAKVDGMLVAEENIALDAAPVK